MARLTLPLKFVDEANANSCIEASGLFPIGARAVQGQYGRWFVMIDKPRNPQAILKHLAMTMPGLIWTLTEDEVTTP